jgi:hypothetical protein
MAEIAAPRQTCDSLATELGISRNCVRQLEANAVHLLSHTSGHDRYAPLRWRATSATQHVSAPVLPAYLY